MTDDVFSKYKLVLTLARECWLELWCFEYIILVCWSDIEVETIQKRTSNPDEVKGANTLTLVEMERKPMPDDKIHQNICPALFAKSHMLVYVITCCMLWTDSE